MKSPAPVAGELLNVMQEWNRTLLLSGDSMGHATAIGSPNLLASRVLSVLRKTVNYIKLDR